MTNDPVLNEPTRSLTEEAIQIRTLLHVFRHVIPVLDQLEASDIDELLATIEMTATEVANGRLN